MQAGMTGLNAAFFERFTSRGEALFSDKILSVMRNEFEGHPERSTPKAGA